MTLPAPLAVWLRCYYLLFAFLLLLPVVRARTADNLRGVIWSDAEGYYVYLPAVFNLHDVHAIPEGSMNVRKNEKGETVVKYTCGVALFELPFFLVARAYADAHGVPRSDIYSKHYSRAVALAAHVAAFLGLFFLQRALRRRGLREPLIALTLLGIYAGTNLFHYATKEGGMSHAYSFCLMAALAWLVPYFYERPTLGRAAGLGALLGWLVLIRPTTSMAALFVLLYEVYSWADLKARLSFWLRHWLLAATAAVVGFLFLTPQLLYWHELTGHWVRYSYEGEGFIFWRHPKLAEVLFDPQNGLFVYSPVVLLALAGLVVGWRQRAFHAPVLTLLFVLMTYVFASWWAWWFGGAFGHRSYIEYYALLAFPLAGALDWVARRVRSDVWKTLAVEAYLLLIFYSVRLSYLYETLPKPWDGPEWRWNFDKLLWVWSYLFHNP